ncbi:carboxymuconolactone decarboxylase family protein [Gordonia sp. CPCC 205333]|uniref:carboxymuconolactone decarboxylase family protein n=1 Tax=Gordonia sp. CPCC 205333 TaxID=3140790 RepID=UPI003AF37435
MTVAPEQTRMWMPASNPVVYKALVALQRASSKDLDAGLVELIYIRASQINGCAYCLHMHTSDALESGADPVTLGLIAAWRESTGIFDDRERAALALTDEVTRIAESGVRSGVFEAARAVFDDYELGQVLASIAMINTWNRIAISGGYPTSFDERESG